jgi:HisA/HisF family protein
MRIVPVLDIKNGAVVRGVGGAREAYRPIETPLCAGARPADVMAALDGLAGEGGFAEAYVADLDAIERGTPDVATLDELRAAFPGKRFWVDAGLRGAEDARRLAARPGVLPVIGSETLRGADEIRALRGIEVALSLDFRGEAPLGDPALFREAALWPDRVIVMTLSRVGSGAGPDLDRLRAMKAMAGGREVYAAGGLRDAADLDALAAIGVAGVLVASALHDGRLGAQAPARARSG